MTLYYISYQFIKKIANAVKSKLGMSGKVKVSDIPFLIDSIQGGGDGKLYKKIENKLANKLTVLSSFSCTESSEKYNITVIPFLTPTEQNTTV